MSEFTLIEASNGAKPKVVGVAYSGGKMNLPGWRHPVVVDLAGMELPESVPLLTNHENKTDSRIGIISAAVRNNALEITGEIVSDSKDAADIIAQGKAGADWQLSIGADVGIRSKWRKRACDKSCSGTALPAGTFHEKRYSV